MDLNKKLKDVKRLVFAGGLYNPVGKSVKAVNSALKADTAKALLKNKLGMEAVSAKAKSLGAKAMVNPAKAKYAGQIAKKAATRSALGLGAVAGAALIGGAAIIHARKKVDKAVDEANKASQQTVKNAQMLGVELKKRKAATGMSLSQRQDARKKAVESEWNRKYKNKLKSTDFTKWK